MQKRGSATVSEAFVNPKMCYHVDTCLSNKFFRCFSATMSLFKSRGDELITYVEYGKTFVAPILSPIEDTTWAQTEMRGFMKNVQAVFAAEKL